MNYNRDDVNVCSFAVFEWIFVVTPAIVFNFGPCSPCCAFLASLSRQSRSISTPLPSPPPFAIQLLLPAG